MSNLEPGTYQLPRLLQKLSGTDLPSDAFTDSIGSWRDLKTTSVDLGELKKDKFIVAKF